MSCADHLVPDTFFPLPMPRDDVQLAHLRPRAWRHVAKLSPAAQLRLVIATMCLRRASAGRRDPFGVGGDR